MFMVGNTNTQVGTFFLDFCSTLTFYAVQLQFFFLIIVKLYNNCFFFFYHCPQYLNHSSFEYYNIFNIDMYYR